MRVARSARAGAEAARRLVCQLLYPVFPRALFGVDALAEGFDDGVLLPSFDSKPIRKAVVGLLKSIEKP